MTTTQSIILALLLILIYIGCYALLIKYTNSIFSNNDNLLENNKLVNKILDHPKRDADMLITKQSIVNGSRHKLSKDIRSLSKSNFDNAKKYFDEELNEHESRMWWGDDDLELSRFH